MRGCIYWFYFCGSVFFGVEEMCGKECLFKVNKFVGMERKCGNRCINLGRR